MQFKCVPVPTKALFLTKLVRLCNGRNLDSLEPANRAAVQNLFDIFCSLTTQLELAEKAAPAKDQAKVTCKCARSGDNAVSRSVAGSNARCPVVPGPKVVKPRPRVPVSPAAGALVSDTATSPTVTPKPRDGFLRRVTSRVTPLPPAPLKTDKQVVGPSHILSTAGASRPTWRDTATPLVASRAAKPPAESSAKSSVKTKILAKTPANVTRARTAGSTASAVMNPRAGISRTPSALRKQPVRAADRPAAKVTSSALAGPRRGLTKPDKTPTLNESGPAHKNRSGGNAMKEAKSKVDADNKVESQSSTEPQQEQLSTESQQEQRDQEEASVLDPSTSQAVMAILDAREALRKEVADDVMAHTDAVIDHLKSVLTSGTHAANSKKMNVNELLATSRLFEGKTPGTGNCQYYALVEAVTGKTVRGVPIDQQMRLETATGALKRGICASGELHLDGEYVTEVLPHVVEEAGGHPEDSRSVEQCKAFIRNRYQSIASSSSSVDHCISNSQWGSGMTLLQAVRVLDCPVYLCTDTPRGQATVTRYSPANPTGPASTYRVTEDTALMSFTDWATAYVADLTAARAGEGPMPAVLVLRRDTAHYNSVMPYPASVGAAEIARVLRRQKEAEKRAALIKMLETVERLKAMV